MPVEVEEKTAAEIRIQDALIAAFDEIGREKTMILLAEWLIAYTAAVNGKVTTYDNGGTGATVVVTVPDWWPGIRD